MDLDSADRRLTHRGFRRRARQLRLIRKLRGSGPRFVGDEAEEVAAAVDAARASSALGTARHRLPRAPATASGAS